MDEALTQLSSLYDLHDHYFTADKQHKQLKLKHMVDEILDLLQDVQSKNPREAATMYYIKGKALDVFSQYNAESEALLMKAVKLDPRNADAWTSLANCFWKKGDLPAARNSLTSCLEFQKDKKALRDLSMLLRQMGTTAEETCANIQTSVIRAKEALRMDMKDGQSWYVLGNAFLALFFCNTHSPSDLDRAFAAYAHAESGGADQNPDLHYNKANVCRYKEDYQSAVESYEKAHALDPSLPALEAIKSILRWVSRVEDLVRNNGHVKPKKLESLVASIPFRDQIQGRICVPISALQAGRNEGKVVVLKLLLDVVRNNEPPGSFIMIDQEKTCAVISIYHLDNQVYSKMTDKDVVYILDPLFKHIELGRPESKTSISYKCLQVAEPHLFLVNGEVMAESYAHARVKLDNFDL